MSELLMKIDERHPAVQNMGVPLLVFLVVVALFMRAGIETHPALTAGFFTYLAVINLLRRWIQRRHAMILVFILIAVFFWMCRDYLINQISIQDLFLASYNYTMTLLFLGALLWVTRVENPVPRDFNMIHGFLLVGVLLLAVSSIIYLILQFDPDFAISIVIIVLVGMGGIILTFMIPPKLTGGIIRGFLLAGVLLLAGSSIVYLIALLGLDFAPSLILIVLLEMGGIMLILQVALPHLSSEDIIYTAIVLLGDVLALQQIDSGRVADVFLLRLYTVSSIVITIVLFVLGIHTVQEERRAEGDASDVEHT